MDIKLTFSWFACELNGPIQAATGFMHHPKPWFLQARFPGKAVTDQMLNQRSPIKAYKNV